MKINIFLLYTKKMTFVKAAVIATLTKQSSKWDKLFIWA